MNTISKIHQEFSRRLNNPRVLTNPEEFLGENFEAVLNFWMILEELSEEQWRVIKERYEAYFDETHSEWRKAVDLANDASEEVVGEEYVDIAYVSAGVVTKFKATGWATSEIIGMHEILENHQHPLTFLPMFLEVFI